MEWLIILLLGLPLLIRFIRWNKRKAYFEEEQRKQDEFYENINYIRSKLEEKNNSDDQ